MQTKPQLCAIRESVPAFLCILCLALLCPPRTQAASSATTKFEHAEYFQATSGGQKKAAPAVKGALALNAEKKSLEFVDKTGAAAITVNYGAIRSLLYEQTSKPRYAAAIFVSPMFLLSHSKKHYLTIQYEGKDGTGQYLIIRLDKSNARQAIAALEAETGRRVERAEEK